MKNKIVIIVLIVVVVVAAILIGYRFFPKNNQTAEGNNQPTDGQSQNKLVTDDFELVLPAGWQQTTAPVGASAMAVNNNENLNDAAAQKINFKTYVAVSYDTLQGKTLNEYLQGIEDQLKQAIPGVVFSEKNNATINSRPALGVEANLAQQGVNFRLLMVAVKGDNDDVWVMSFNTLQASWMEYQGTFSDIANSFKLKI
ncbi:MAG: hypothetical protein PHO90_01775 [Candidatus Pacebacteria bacterium]|nr:hypothetical protein [Candidatus Paceibacterota bacterium]